MSYTITTGLHPGNPEGCIAQYNHYVKSHPNPNHNHHSNPNHHSQGTSYGAQAMSYHPGQNPMAYGQPINPYWRPHWGAYPPFY